jgi:hypothetical protein
VAPHKYYNGMGSSINIGWDKYETALLIEAYLRCKDGLISRKQAITALSRTLRAQKVKAGVDISETYRNDNGITLQMAAMEFYLTNGERGFGSPSTMFKEVADLYMAIPEKFEELVKTAKMIYPASDEMQEVRPIKPKEETTGVFAAETPQRYVNEKVRHLVKERFPKGYRLGSYMEVKKLKTFYEAEYHEPLDMAAEDIEADVKSCGIVHEGRVYLIEDILREEVRDEIVTDIEATFSSGKNFVFLSVLFEKFHDELLDSQILDSQMLEEYLFHFYSDRWHFTKDYICLDFNVPLDVFQEVVEYVKEQGGVVFEDEVVKGLSFLPEKDVRDAFDSRNSFLISCGRNQRFHIENFVVTDVELKIVERIIREAISLYKYISFSELLNDIRIQVPSVLDDNETFGEIGLRNVLNIKLTGKFSFINNIISDKAHPVSAEDAFVALGQREAYTIDEVTKLAQDCGSLANLYIDNLLNYSVRVSKEQFVAKHLVHFDVHETDKLLETLCPKGFMGMREVAVYSVFPDCGYQWNEFLLESYVAKHSQVFAMLHSDYFNQTRAVGAIVKKDMADKGFKFAVSLALGESGIVLSKENALDYLYEKGYVARRSNKNIDDILKGARKIRKE